MSPVGETTRTHTRLLKCALEVEDSRAYWRRAEANATPPATPALTAFSEFWFGSKSLPRIQVLLQNFRVRYDAFPDALAVLHAWSESNPDTLAAAAPLICHWHTQLTDPLYRAFTVFLAQRRDGPNPSVTRDVTLTWVDGYPDAAPRVGSEAWPTRTHQWTVSTRIQFASKLLSAAYAAGLVTSNSERSPRPLAAPRVPDMALSYLLYLLRPLAAASLISGSLSDNPYLASVGLTVAAGSLEARLRQLPESFDFRRQGALVDLGFRHADLTAWASATLGMNSTNGARPW